ncbi:MAG TPA: hypothetical protein VNW06_08355 [Cytophagaceae bacterium]|nr:hypothetical protein [Cytophagaceae bacterium]
MDISAIISDEIKDNFKTTAIVIPPPYNENMELEEKFSIVYRELQRKTRIKNRILALMNAFYLGKLLDEIPERSILSRYQNRVTSHFLRLSRNTFEIFKDFPEQIGETSTITVQILRKLKRNEISRIISNNENIIINSIFE